MKEQGYDHWLRLQCRSSGYTLSIDMILATMIICIFYDRCHTNLESRFALILLGNYSCARCLRATDDFFAEKPPTKE